MIAMQPLTPAEVLKYRLPAGQWVGAEVRFRCCSCFCCACFCCARCARCARRAASFLPAAAVLAESRRRTCESRRQACRAPARPPAPLASPQVPAWATAAMLDYVFTDDRRSVWDNNKGTDFHTLLTTYASGVGSGQPRLGAPAEAGLEAGSCRAVLRAAAAAACAPDSRALIPPSPTPPLRLYFAAPQARSWSTWSTAPWTPPPPTTWSIRRSWRPSA